MTTTKNDWQGITMYTRVKQLIELAREDSGDVAIEELISLREDGSIPKSAVNWVINKFLAAAI